MCGIVGIVSQNPVNESIYAALTLLQHRGQDAAGLSQSMMKIAFVCVRLMVL